MSDPVIEPDDDSIEILEDTIPYSFIEHIPITIKESPVEETKSVVETIEEPPVEETKSVVETKPETSSSENKVSIDVSHDPFFESYFKRS